MNSQATLRTICSAVAVAMIRSTVAVAMIRSTVELAVIRSMVARGNDTLSGGAGDDTLNGGPGADIFVVMKGEKADTLKLWSDTMAASDFSRTEGDVIVLKGFSDADQTDRNTVVDTSGANALVNVAEGDTSSYC